jgi:predicted alpha/beta-fold hydrolase
MKLNNKPVLLSAICGLFLNMAAGASDYQRETDFAEAISKTLTVGKIVWLEAEGRKFLALHTDTESAITKGAVIILHDSGGHPDQQQVVHSLRTVLPAHNWTTLALQIPIREIGAGNHEYYALFPEAHARINAGIQYLKQNGAETIVLVGYGLGGLMAVSALAQPMPDIKALVAISLPVPDTAIKTAQTLDFLKHIKSPLLDIYGGLDQPDVVASARDRRVAAQENTDYRQIRIDDEGHEYLHDEGLLVKRIYSWLARIADNAEKQ